jgi:ATP-binding cassette subfamily B protein|tara:strand:- start:2104 stop:3315 length:1212 start_codon:yes stop_codon:yes gene_type:complete
MAIPLARYWALLASYLKGQTGLFALLTVLLVSSIGFKLLIPQVTRAFIDSAMAGDAVSQLLLLAGAFIGIAVLQQLLAVGATWSGEVVAWNATNQLRIDVAEHTLHLDMAFHKDKTPGEMIQRLDEDVTALARFFSQLVVIVGGNLLLMVGVLAMFFVEHFWLGVAFTVFSCASLYLLNRLREFAIPLEMKRREALADLLGYLEERLSGTEDVRSSGAVGYIINGLYRVQSNLLYHWKNVQFRYWLLGVISRLITVVGYSLAFIGGYYLFNDGVIGISTAFLIIHYMGMLASPLQQLSSQVEGLQGVGASIERLSELMVEESSIKDGSGLQLPSGPLAVGFDGVSFGYEEGEPVLRDISLQLQAGKVLGVLGRTGSGKTTITRLIFRLYDPDQGTIRIGDRDV